MATLTPEQEAFVRLARVARLATADADGMPHVVPVCPLLDDGKLYAMSEASSKKVRNLESNPRASFVFDEYHEDWQGLRGLLIQGSAALIREGSRWQALRECLYEKFPQFPDVAPIEAGDVMIEVSIDRVAGEI